jgi:hypothetical protein
MAKHFLHEYTYIGYKFGGLFSIKKIKSELIKTILFSHGLIPKRVMAWR